jgi:hypothetical protein
MLCAAALLCTAGLQACLKERTKFKQETFSNVGGRLNTASLRESGAGKGSSSSSRSFTTYI